MWLFTPFGFFSIVKKRGDSPGTLTVRARVAADLDNLRTLVVELGPTFTTPGHDYPFRARVSAEALAAGMSRITLAIDYDNFKDEVNRQQGRRREGIYHQVWAVLRDVAWLGTGRRS